VTPKEKAKELYHKYQVYEVNDQKRTQYGPQVKVFALIAVDEILNEYWSHNTDRRDWWKEVKQEIEKL
jgi:hypothetical protein